jgi:5-formyltetrahydrofolate cyclo-ligase
MNTKQEIRKALLAKRMALPAVQREKAQDLLLINMQKLPLPFLQLVHAYQPMPERHEPDPNPLVRWLQIANPSLELVVPRMLEDLELAHLIVTEDTTWERNGWGIPEPLEGEAVFPDELDLVFVPLLGFDQNGNRIGYGKGFYDRFLKDCRPETLKIGLSFLEPIPSIPSDPWDVPLDYVITPQYIYAFT